MEQGSQAVGDAAAVGESMSLKETEAECAAVAVAPRVSLKDIEAAIAHQYHFRGDEAVMAMGAEDIPGSLKVLSVCILVLANGWTVIGKSAPASAKNFDAALGWKLAYEDAIRQLWPLMGFALRDKLAKESA